MSQTAHPAYGGGDFGELRALCAAQRHGEELLARAEATTSRIEARAEATVVRVLMQAGSSDRIIGQLASDLHALLQSERDAVSVALRQMHESLAEAHRP